ncbi:MAG: sugar phosphate isomerase/epimerase [Spirochaetales bacterium]|nr:sugar phosphate isomerase/epimerase [Spirochaetales bacterium]
MKKVAFSTGAFYTMDTLEAVGKLRKAGFEHMELMPQCHEDLSLRTLSEITKKGMHVSSIHYPLVFFGILYNANPGMMRESMAFSDNLAVFCKEAGTEYVVIHPEQEYSGRFAELCGKPIRANIEYLASALDKVGVTVAMENYPSGVGQYPDTLQAYVKEMAIPNMKIMVDTTEVIEGGGDPIEFIKGLEVAPCHLHMSDFGGGLKHIPIGTGEVDWKAVVKTLKDKGYTGYYNLEPSYKYYIDDVDTQLRKDYEYITSLV